MMFEGLSPGLVSSLPTFVAIIIWLLLPLFFIQLPMIVSDSPPIWPGAHWEYISAVSMKFPPLSA